MCWRCSDVLLIFFWQVMMMNFRFCCGSSLNSKNSWLPNFLKSLHRGNFWKNFQNLKRRGHLYSCKEPGSMIWDHHFRVEKSQTFVSDAMFQYSVFCARVSGTVWSNWTNTPFESQYLRTIIEVRIHSPIIYNFRKLVDIGFWLLEMGMKQLQEVRNSVGVTW